MNYTVAGMNYTLAVGALSNSNISSFTFLFSLSFAEWVDNKLYKLIKDIIYTVSKFIFTNQSKE